MIYKIGRSDPEPLAVASGIRVSTSFHLELVPGSSDAAVLIRANETDVTIHETTRRTHEPTLKVIWLVSIRVAKFRDIFVDRSLFSPRELQRT
jgi:hypothetical protein